MKKPQKKFIDPKKKSSASIRQPREVEGRRDIELLFQDIPMEDLTKIVEKKGMNAIIELRQKKFEQSNSSRNVSNKRPKLKEHEDFQEGQEPQKEDPLFERKVLDEALAFQRELQGLRYDRVQFARDSLRKSMHRQSIGSSGYGRFLCSHYNPGSSFISSLNSISQKYETKIKEKKRIKKEHEKKEDGKGEQAEKENQEESKDNKESGKDEKNGKAQGSKDSREEKKKESKDKSKDDKGKTQQSKTEKKSTKDPKSKSTKESELKSKGEGKGKEKSRNKEEGKVVKSKNKASRGESKMVHEDKSIEKVTEDLKDEVNIEELQQ